jgi:hypothetical protein
MEIDNTWAIIEQYELELFFGLKIMLIKKRSLCG